MPGYKTHTIANLLVLGGLCYVATEHYSVAPSLVVTSSIAFVGATLFLSPDLDLKHSSPTRNWGLLRWLWRPYQMLFKHRGLSHSLLFSSATRIGYLICMIATALIATHAWANSTTLGLIASNSQLTDPIATMLSSHGEQLAAIGIGIAFSDTCHIVTDRGVSALKSLFKNLLW